MRTRIPVYLNERELDALRLAAERELRDLRGQARYFIVKGLAADLAAAAEVQPVKLAEAAKGCFDAQQF
jgi:hypothetical protein